MFKHHSPEFWVDGAKTCKANKDVIHCYLIEMYSLPQIMVKYKGSKCDYTMIPIQKVSIDHGIVKALTV